MTTVSQTPPLVAPVPYAEPYVLGHADLLRAAESLEQWAAHPAWTNLP